jgi:hypothetical protein
MNRRQKGIAAVAIMLGSTPFVLSTSAHAATSTYWTTGSPIPVSPTAAISGTSNHTGNRTSGCSSGTWVKYTALRTGGGSLIRERLSNFCGGSTHPAEPSTKALCGSQTGGTWYANCIRTY